jgi:hypothetical protein
MTLGFGYGEVLLALSYVILDHRMQFWISDA